MTIVNVHASCIVLARAGAPFGVPEDAAVLILGASGSGKSDLALRLIERGAMLVADDRTDLFARNGRLWGRPPAVLAGLIEIRGVGIVALPFRSEAAIALAIDLVERSLVPRHSREGTYVPPGELELSPSARPPLLRLDGRDSSAPAKVVAAASAYAHSLFRDGRTSP